MQMAEADRAIYGKKGVMTVGLSKLTPQLRNSKPKGKKNKKKQELLPFAARSGINLSKEVWIIFFGEAEMFTTYHIKVMLSSFCHSYATCVN
jgi:hypothetical protein